MSSKNEPPYSRFDSSVVIDLTPHYAGGDGGNPPGGGQLDNSDLNTRLSRIEGGWAIYQWAVGVVSAVIIGGMAIMISFQISGQSELKGQQIQIEAKLDGLIRSVDQLTAKVDQNIALSNAMNGSIREIRTEVINPMATVPPQ